jgi:hypothetical protein
MTSQTKGEKVYEPPLFFCKTKAGQTVHSVSGLNSNVGLITPQFTFHVHGPAGVVLPAALNYHEQRLDCHPPSLFFGMRHRPFSAQDFSPTARASRENSSAVVPVPRSDSARQPQVKVSIEKTSFLVGSTPN